MDTNTEAFAAYRRKIVSLTGAVIVAVGDKGRNTGETYALVMGACDLGTFEAVVGLAAGSDLLTERGHFLTLTDKGKSLLAELRATVTPEDIARREAAQRT